MDTNYLILAIVLVGLVLLLAAFNLNEQLGSGNLISETRNVSNFDRVRLSGLGDLTIIQDGEESLIVETDDNLMENIKTEVRGDTLELGFDPTKAIHVSPTQLTFTLHVDDLQSLDIAGSGAVKAESIEAERLDVDVSGSGNIQIDSLIVNELNSKISGAGKSTSLGKQLSKKLTLMVLVNIKLRHGSLLVNIL